jgi:hypothetical protein
MVKVPIWEQNVSDLPGASNTPYATPDTFGAQIGKAQISAAHDIEKGLTSLGGALTEQYNEQEAIKGKTIVSDHETSMVQEEARLRRDTPPDQAYTIPDKLKEIHDTKWAETRKGVSGKFQTQADATVHNWWNRKDAENRISAQQEKDKYVELQIDGAAEKHSAAVMTDPNALGAATAALKSQVEETNVNSFEQRRMKLKYGRQLYDATNKGFEDRARANPTDQSIIQQWDAFRKNGADIISNQLGIQALPPSGGGPANPSRVKQIDKTSAGPVIDEVAKATGVDPNRMKVKASIESGGRAGAVTGNYKGLFQLSDKEFAKYGPPGGNIFDPKDNTLAAANAFIDQDQKFYKANGRMPTLTESYMIHQQGEAGAANHYTNPDRPAWQNMYATGEGRQKGEAWAKKAIWGNVPDDMKKKFGSVENVTSRDFIAMWDAKVTGGKGEPPSPMSVVRVQRGQVEPGNIDVSKQPRVKNADGSISTVRSASFSMEDGKHVLIPTVAHDGSGILSDQAALDQFRQSGKHLGVFDSSTAADEYAQRLHESEARAIATGEKTKPLQVTGEQTLGGTSAAPLLGQTPKEMRQSEEHWDARSRSVQAERERIVHQMRDIGKADFTQEEVAVKAHGQEGGNGRWTREAVIAVFGPSEGQRRLAEREANLAYHGNTQWGPDTSYEQMTRDLDKLDPKYADPQDPAFAQRVKNYEEAAKLMIKSVEAYEKRTKRIGDEKMKEITDTAFNGKEVTDEMIQTAKPFLSDHQLHTALTLRNKPPTRDDAGAMIQLENDSRAQPPDEFRKTLEAAIRNRSIDGAKAGELARRNGDTWRQGLKPPVVSARDHIHGVLTPGVAGLEGEDARKRMELALREYDDFTADPANKPLLDNRAAMFDKADQIIRRARDDTAAAVRDRLPFSRYFDTGSKTRRDIVESDIEAAQAKLDADVIAKRGNVADLSTQQNLINQWRDTLREDQRLKKSLEQKKAVQPGGLKPATKVPPPAPNESPQKMSIIAPPQGVKPLFERPLPSNDQIERPPPSDENPDRNAYRPEDVMGARLDAQRQEDI